MSSADPAEPLPERQQELEDGRWALSVCGLCRYCDGYCPVFPAARRRPALTPGDLAYVANLCHQCGNCWYACQYAPPHPWGINVPQAFAQLRVESYAEHAWPPAMGRLFQRIVECLAI